MPTLGLDHYNLRAAQPLMDALRDFYVEVVGLAVGPRPPFGSPGWWLYAGSRPILHLSLASAAEGRAAGGRTTFDHVAFACTDRPAFEALLSTRAIAFSRSVVPGTTRVQLFFADPAGNGVELGFDEG